MANAQLGMIDDLPRKSRGPIALGLAVLLCSMTMRFPAQAQPADSESQPGKPPVVAQPALPLKELGDLQMVRRRYQAAIQAYEQITPKTAEVWNKLGIAYQQMFNTEEAARSYQASLKLDPNNADVLNNMGTIFYSRKQYALAEKSYRKAIKLKPNTPLILKNLGTDLLAEDKFKKGWDCYQAAMAIDPDIFERDNQLRIGEPTPTDKRGAMNYYLAKSYAQAGMWDRAVGYLRMAIDEGFTDRKRIMADKELASLHGKVAFEQLLSEQRAQ